MKRLLLATAAVIALAVAAPIATAQYTTPPPASAPYTTPVPDDPMTPQDESLSAQPDTTATQSQSQVNPPSAAAQTQTDTTYGQTSQYSAQTGATAQAQTQPYSAQAQAGASGQTDTYGTQAQAGMDAQAQDHTQPYSEQAQAGTTGQSDASGQSQPYSAQAQAEQSYGSTTDSYAATSGMGENTATPASLEQHARDAGMDHLPMTAQEVCMPRDLSLTSSGARLNRDKQHQLINATDRASVCQIQRVVISSPNGRADQARQLMVDHGVDASMIEVQDADAGGLEVRMQFAGLATSNEQYAQMFSTQQYANYQPNAAPAPGSSYAPNTGSAYAPSTPANPNTPVPGSSYAPSTTTPDQPEAPGQSYQPSPSAPPMESPSTPAPDATAPGMDDDPMSPTSAQAAPVQPSMLDI